MRRFYTLAGVRDISDEEIRVIRRKANSGDPVACYQLAQLEMAWHWEDNYAEVANDLLLKAQEGGVEDAYIFKALLLYRGEGGYDPETAEKLIRHGIEKRNEYAMFTLLVNLIYGRFGIEKNLEGADQTLKMLLEADECPHWHMLRGDALYALGKREEAVYHYEQALEGGLTEVYGDLAVARGVELDGTVVDYDAMLDTLEEGTNVEDVASMYYTALEDCSLYEQSEDDDTESKDILRELILTYLQACSDYKHVGANELLGDIYREGLYGVPVDYTKAYEHYMMGANFNGGSCYSKLHQMLSNGELSLRSGKQEALDLFALLGARLHGEDMIIETIKAYRAERLAEYAEEIEKYHLPTYKKLSASEKDEDTVSISFEQLTAIVSRMIALGNTDGLLDKESNMIVHFSKLFVNDEAKLKELLCNAIDMDGDKAVKIIKGLDQTTKQGISNAMSLILLADGDISDPEAAMFMELMFDCGIPDPTTQEWLNWLSRDNN